jgi:hypothetical protein
LPFELLDKNSSACDETWRAIAALKRKMVDKCLLDGRQRENFSGRVALRMTFNREDRFAVKEMSIVNARTAFGLGTVRPYLYDSTGVTNALTASEMRSRQVEILM